MKKKVLHRFFLELDRELARPAEIILTGAAAGSLMGNIRPSLDIDFEIRTKGRMGSREKASLQQAVNKVSSKMRMAANYSEDISRWSMINYLDYRKTALPYKTIGRLRLKLIAPAHWTIGKMTRFLEIDIRDMIKIIKKKKLGSQSLLRLWGRALASSPLSLASGRFRDNVIYFIEKYGKVVWGKKLNVKKATSLFKRAAKLDRVASDS